MRYWRCSQPMKFAFFWDTTQCWLVTQMTVYAASCPAEWDILAVSWYFLHIGSHLIRKNTALAERRRSPPHIHIKTTIFFIMQLPGRWFGRGCYFLPGVISITDPLSIFRVNLCESWGSRGYSDSVVTALADAQVKDAHKICFETCEVNDDRLVCQMCKKWHAG